MNHLKICWNKQLNLKRKNKPLFPNGFRPWHTAVLGAGASTKYIQIGHYKPLRKLLRTSKNFPIFMYNYDMPRDHFKQSMFSPTFTSHEYNQTSMGKAEKKIEDKFHSLYNGIKYIFFPPTQPKSGGADKDNTKSP